MSDISIPRSLSEANAVLALQPLLEQLVDPSKRKSIADDIRAFHALNETEAKKAEESRNTINKNIGILDDIRKKSAENSQIKADLDYARKTFEEVKVSEYEKIDQANNLTKISQDKAEYLHKKVVQEQNDISNREIALQSEKANHALSVAKLLEDQNLLAIERRNLEDQKQSIIDLDQSVRAKVDALKKFNF